MKVKTVMTSQLLGQRVTSLFVVCFAILGLGTAPLLAQSNPTQAPTTNAKTPAAPNSETDFLQDLDQNPPTPSQGVQTLPPTTNINLQDGSLAAAQVPGLLSDLLSGSPGYSKLNFVGLVSGDCGAGKPCVDPDAAARKPTVVLNVIVWGDSSKTDAKSASALTPDSRWYVYRNGRLTRQKRLRGVKTFYFVYIHLGRGTTAYDIRYDFTATQATPIPIQHVWALAGLLTGGTATRALGQPNVWGGKRVDFGYRTSDITIASKIFDTQSANSAPTTAPAPTGGSEAGQQGTSVIQAGQLDVPQTFHNEAPSWWDVSLGFPATNVSKLSFSSTGSSGSVPAGLTASQSDNKKLLGLLDIYPFRKQRYEIADNNFSWYPSLVLGLPLAGQPLHKPVFALGWGPPLVELFAGATVVKQVTVPTGAVVVGSKPCTGWCTQFIVGVNFGVKALASKVTSGRQQN